MPLTSCLHCHLSLPPAGKTSRYCPSCGSIRVLPDPPGLHTPVERFIIAGYDIIGGQGRLYGYETSDACPVPIDPVLGPHRTPHGTTWPDLVASSGTPLPESAVYTVEFPDGYPSEPSKRIDATTPLSLVAIRHMRFYTVNKGNIANQLRNHQIQAFDCRTGGLVPQWACPILSLPQAAPCAPVNLQVSETLLYCLVRVNAGTVLHAYDIALGEKRMQLAISCEKPRVFISGDHLVILPQVSPSRPDKQIVQIHRVSSWKNPTPAVPPPFEEYELPVAAPLGELPPIIAVGTSLVFASGDGKVYAIDIVDGQPQRPARLLWSNPNQSSLWSYVVPLDNTTIAFVATESSQGGNVILVEIQGHPANRATFSRASNVPLVPSSRSRFITAWNGDIFAAIHPAGEPITVYRLTRRGETFHCDALKKFDATDQADIREFFAFPYQGARTLYLHYLASPAAFSPHRFLIDDTGQEKTLEEKPDAVDTLQGFWHTGTLWAANLTRGKIVSVQ